jgi:tripartite-type tricarboxylate transporter receptor subunit TctC
MSRSHEPCRRALLSAAAAWLAVGPARAQVYPSRAVRLIVPAPAGTSPDAIARMWGERFVKATGQPVVVDNKPGASTFLAAQAVATAPADGHTLLYTVNSTFSINPFVFKKLPYKTEDFAPVTRILSVPYVLLVSAQSRLRTLADLIQEARARPGQLNYSSGGIASGFHVATARLLNEAGVTMTHVPYKDYFLPDLIAQRIDVGFDASTGAIPQIRAGKVRALAVTSPRRIEALPDVPAIAEAFPGFVADSWHGLFAPRATPDAIIKALVAQSQRIVDAMDFRAALRELALTPVGGGAEEFRRFLADDAQAWAKVVRNNQITAE